MKKNAFRFLHSKKAKPLLKFSNRGFTLVELLVVISIIAILTTIGIALFRGSTEKARDSIRKDDLNKLALALEIYAQRNNGSYITAASSCSSSSTFYTTIIPSSRPSLYISTGIAPRDPKTGSMYCYISANGTNYTLCADLENNSDGDRNNLCPSGYDYGVVPK